MARVAAPPAAGLVSALRNGGSPPIVTPPIATNVDAEKPDFMRSGCIVSD